jgi:glyoxylase-like metal-dependent hydrolase (beta-lactamase superfamily II)
MSGNHDSNRRWLHAGAAAALLAIAAGPAAAQPSRQPSLDVQLSYATRAVPTGTFQLVPLRELVQVRGQEGVVTVQNGLYVLQGPDGNVTVQVGPEGAVVIDAQRKELGEPLVAELKKLIGPVPIRFFFTTNGDPERAGAGEIVRKAGKAVFGGNMAGQASDLANEAVHLSHENVLLRLSGSNGRDPASEEGLWPKETYAEGDYDFHFNDEGVQLFHAPAAHTDGDSIVFFRRSDVVVAGDLWDTNTYPRIDLARGGGVDGVIAGLNHVIELTIPGAKQEGGTLVVPGRGRPGDESEVVEYRDMVVIIRDRIKDMADKGRTLEQVKAAKPTFDYDGRYGAATGPWTTDMFIAAVYEGVKPQRRGRAAR